MITIEEINGEKYTVVWHHQRYDYIAEYDNEQPLETGEIIISDKGFNHIATALPALPRYPKAKDALLLHRYMAEGIMPEIEVDGCGGYDMWDWLVIVYAHDTSLEITYATHNGERVEIAIKENKMLKELEEVRGDFTGRAETIVATGYQMFEEHKRRAGGKAMSQSLSICDAADYYLAKAGYEAALRALGLTKDGEQPK